MPTSPNIAVLVPCHNEQLTIAKVVDDFRRELPDATIYVVDNCCTDRTADVAREHGAVVLREPRQGKGFVVESLLRRVRADAYVMVDGDDTYPAEKVHDLLKPVLEEQADMAVGARLADYGDQSFRPLHVAGNRLVCGLINRIFRAGLTDILSGYRAFSHRIVECVPVVSAGFEVETELTVQMLYFQLKIMEVQVPYRGRPEGSHSKLSTVRDGLRVLRKVFSLFRTFKPLTFFGLVGLAFFVLGVLAGLPPIYGFIASGYREVRRFPLAFLAGGLMILSFSSVFAGVILHTVNQRVRELHNVLIRRR